MSLPEFTHMTEEKMPMKFKKHFKGFQSSKKSTSCPKVFPNFAYKLKFRAHNILDRKPKMDGTSDDITIL